MLNKKNTSILFFLAIFIFINFLLFSTAGEESASPADNADPVDTEIMEEMIEPILEGRYTDLEFSNLSDEEKKDVYFNKPHLLPENFNPILYMYIFHPETEEREN